MGEEVQNRLFGNGRRKKETYQTVVECHIASLIGVILGTMM